MWLNLCQSSEGTQKCGSRHKYLTLRSNNVLPLVALDFMNRTTLLGGLHRKSWTCQEALSDSDLVAESSQGIF